MHRPLREPIHLRVWRLIRGLLFYNTVYWRRASDGLNMPTLSAEERERQRPERNLDIIRPRLKPRAHLEAARGGELSVPQQSSVPLEGSAEDDPGEQIVEGEHGERPPHGAEMVADDGTEQVYVKRRRYRRRLVAGGSAVDRGGFIARVFGKR